MSYAFVAALGSLVALGELISRYRDSPGRAVRDSKAAWFYIFLNAAASVSALSLMKVFSVTFGQTGAALEWTQTLVAGVSAMAFFRTSIFTVRLGDKDLGVGPISFLQVLLGASDRAVDRDRAAGRAAEVNSLVSGLAYEKAFISLPAFCLALMQNLTREDQEALGKSLVTLQGMQLPENVKLKIMVVYLINAVGPDALQSAIRSLGEDLQHER